MGGHLPGSFMAEIFVFVRGSFVAEIITRLLLGLLSG
jgi:hypothetical protein